jgi:hypothetical protein
LGPLRYSGKIIALLRGACLPWAHPHSASKLIRGSIKQFPERFLVVTATCCAAVGEVGTIYQAAGFDYLGPMYRGTRALIRYAGKIVSERQAKRKFGTCRRRALARPGISSYLVPRRSRYFPFRGDQHEQGALPRPLPIGSGRTQSERKPRHSRSGLGRWCRFLASIRRDGRPIMGHGDGAGALTTQAGTIVPA